MKAATTNNPARRRYPSDLNERQWARVVPLLPGRLPRGRPPVYGLRDVVDAINYRWRTGCVWRMLPHDFPPWSTVYGYFRTWQHAGVLRQLQAAVVQPNRPSPATAGGHRNADWPIDSNPVPEQTGEVHIG